MLAVAAISPAEDERQMHADDAPALDLGAVAALPMAAGARSTAAVWHRFMRGPVVGNFLHDQMEWLAGEGFALQVQDNPEVSEPLAARLLRRCERAGRKDQAADVLQWLRAVVHQPLAPLGVSLAELGAQDALLAEMEFWLPAQRLSATCIDALCRKHILPGLPRPTLPERELLRQEIERSVFATVQALPEELRTAITMREMDGLSYEEIAEKMACPIGTVRSRIFRAREAIDETLRPLLSER